MLARLGCPSSTLIFAVLACACGPDGVSTSGSSSSEASEATSGPSSSEESGDESADTSAASSEESTDTAEESTDTSEESTGETGEDPTCAHYIRLDLCCNQPFPASAEDVEADPCVTAWPVDWEALPEDQLASCVAMQPESCEFIDCDHVDPPTEDIELGDEGSCRWVCPEGLSIAYAEPGCGDPPAIAECLPPPPPCAQDFCSCEGETVIGCGVVGEPFAHMGPCS